MPHDIFFIGTNYYSSSTETKKILPLEKYLLDFLKHFVSTFPTFRL